MSTPGRLEDLLRELAPQVLGLLVRRHGEFADAEDAVQEALLAAATAWPRDGIPGNPYGWLVTVASRRLVSIWRTDAARRDREHRAVLNQPDPPRVSDVDESLLLLFLCCHPVLPPASAIPLTLRAVGGLTTAEIARVFLTGRMDRASAGSLNRTFVLAGLRPIKIGGLFGLRIGSTGSRSRKREYHMTTTSCLVASRRPG